MTQRVQSVERALALLEAVASSEYPMSVPELAATAGVSRAACIHQGGQRNRGNHPRPSAWGEEISSEDAAPNSGKPAALQLAGAVVTDLTV
jgi:hypothetical protein